jgi:hypothetical protein
MNMNFNNYRINDGLNAIDSKNINKVK